MERSARQAQSGAGGNDEARSGRQGGDGGQQLSSSLTIGRPRSKAAFFLDVGYSLSALVPQR